MTGPKPKRHTAYDAVAAADATAAKIDRTDPYKAADQAYADDAAAGANYLAADAKGKGHSPASIVDRLAKAGGAVEAAHRANVASAKADFVQGQLRNNLTKSIRREDR